MSEDKPKTKIDHLKESAEQLKSATPFNMRGALESFVKQLIDVVELQENELKRLDGLLLR